MHGTRPELLVVAGEASGDRIAAAVVRALAPRGVRAFGLGGPACRDAGVELAAGLEPLGAMGALDVARRLPSIARAVARLASQTRASPPAAALLVDAPELNARVGRLLRARGVRVLWCVAPQVWAWRAGRLRSLRGVFDRLAVVLPFEEALWRDAGHDARWIGHPSFEGTPPSRDEARAVLGIAPDANAVAVLPGSRPGEVARLLDPLVDAAARLLDAHRVDRAVVVVAAALPAPVRARIADRARRAGLAIVSAPPDEGASAVLAAFDVALAASGTACLEAALAGAAPVVAARLDPLAYAVARRLVRTRHVALPNILLGRRAFPELVQHDVTSDAVARAAAELLSPASAKRIARDVAALRDALAPPDPAPFGARVARLVEPWLSLAPATRWNREPRGA